MNCLVDQNAFGTFFSAHLDAIDIACLKLTCRRYKTYFDKLYPPLKSYDRATWIVIMAMRKGYWNIAYYFSRELEAKIPAMYKISDPANFIKSYPLYAKEETKSQELMFGYFLPNQTFTFDLACESGNPIIIESKIPKKGWFGFLTTDVNKWPIVDIKNCILGIIKCESLEGLKYIKKKYSFQWPKYIDYEHRKQFFYCKNIQTFEWALLNGIKFYLTDVHEGYSPILLNFIEDNFPGVFDFIYPINDEYTALLKFEHYGKECLSEAIRSKHLLVIKKAIETFKPDEFPEDYYPLEVLDLPLSLIRDLHKWKPLEYLYLMKKFYLIDDFEKLLIFEQEGLIQNYKLELLISSFLETKFGRDRKFQQYILNKDKITTFTLYLDQTDFCLKFLEKFPECWISFSYVNIQDVKVLKALQNHKYKLSHFSEKGIFASFISLEICLSLLPTLNERISMDITLEIAKGKTWIFDLLKDPLVKKEHYLYFDSRILRKELSANSYHETLKALFEY